MRSNRVYYNWREEKAPGHIIAASPVHWALNPMHASSVGGKGYRRFRLIEHDVMRGEKGRSHASTTGTALESSSANCSAISAKQHCLKPPQRLLLTIMGTA